MVFFCAGRVLLLAMTGLLPLGTTLLLDWFAERPCQLSMGGWCATRR